MFPLLIPMAAGAVGGALLKKKDPLKGALLGAGLGAGAAAAAPAIGGLLGGSGAAAAAPWADGAGAIVAPAAGPETGLLASTNAALKEYAPMLNAASTGIQMSGALDQQPEQAAPAPAPMNQGGAEVLAQIAGQGGANMSADMQERARRRAMLRGGV
jgi:hypothetical protein